MNKIEELAKFTAGISSLEGFQSKVENVSQRLPLDEYENTGINNESILELCVKKFIESNLFYKVVIVCNKNFIDNAPKDIVDECFAKLKEGNLQSERINKKLKLLK